jgi:hypothetical protein
MSERTVTAADVNRCLFPAINVLRGIELNLHDHSDCPYRKMSVRAIDNLMDLLDLATGKKGGDHPT